MKKIHYLETRHLCTEDCNKTEAICHGWTSLESFAPSSAWLQEGRVTVQHTVLWLEHVHGVGVTFNTS